MGKMNELFLLLDELIETGNKLTEAAFAIKECFSSEPVGLEPGKFEPEPEPILRPQLSKTDVRSLLVEKSNLSGGKYKPQIKALVKKYAEGGTFSAIKPEEYEALVAELEVVCNA